MYGNKTSGGADERDFVTTSGGDLRKGVREAPERTDPRETHPCP
jgi:hypothetical protein